jgi:serine/threonine-protein kinase
VGEVPQEVRVIGRYALYGPIASGGMATVHYGRLLGPVGFSRTVAIKRLHAQFAKDPEFVAMFLDEARLAARIRHPHVVPTLDVVATGGEVFLVMEYVQGESLTRLWRAHRDRRMRIPPPIASAIAGGVLQGLHAAHEAKNERSEPLGIVHRDVSPQNILVGVDGQARVLDFGVAKAAGRTQSTRDGSIKGKIAYMAPEQLRGESVTRRTDVFAASTVIWEMLAGQRLFKAENEGAVVLKVISGGVRPPSEVAGDPSIAAFDDVVLRGLSARPEDRFETAREMMLALERCGPAATTARVGEWVESIAHDVLAARARTVTEIETSEPSRPPSGEIKAISVLPPVHAPAEIDPPSGSQNTRGSLVASATPPPVHAWRRRSVAVALVVASVAVLGSAAAIVAFRSPSHAAVAMPLAPTYASLPPAPAAPLPSTPPAPSATAPPAASSAPAPVASAAKAAPPPPTSRAPAPAQPARGADCSPPYYWDAQGVKHFKPNCL